MKLEPKGIGWKVLSDKGLNFGSIHPAGSCYEFWPSVQKPNWTIADLTEICEILKRCNERREPSNGSEDFEKSG